MSALISWLALGGIYALLALGLAVIFSILGLINFAHGELVTVTGYAIVGLAAATAFPAPVIVLLAVVAAGLAGLGMERIAFRPVRNAPVFAQLVTTLALSLLIQTAFQVFVGGRPLGLGIPLEFGAIRIWGAVAPVADLAAAVTTIGVMVVLTVFLRRSVLGLALRAAAEDFETTRLMGFSAQRIVSGAFLVSGMLAGVAAIFILAEAGLVGPTSGFNPLVKAFIGAIIGGLGSLHGAVLGGYILAALELSLRSNLPSGVLPMTDAFTFAVVIAFLLFRPNGLWGDPTLKLDRA